MENTTECCANCSNCIAVPKNNSYGDIDHWCLCTGYYLTGIHKDHRKVRRYSPGGKELTCDYRAKENIPSILENK